MAILKIARMGHPVLRQRAETVADPTAPEMQRLIDDMIETMGDADGLGLAAPQVHVARRLVVFHRPGAAGEEDDDMPLVVLFNPEIEPLGEETSFGWEGCLSVPGMRGLVPRRERVLYRGLDREGRTLETEAGGMHARVVQHECDHLDGILFPMRMTDLSMLYFESELKHYRGAEPAEDEAPARAEAMA